MRPKFTLLEVTFLVLSIVGMALTWYFNSLFYLSAEDISITNFITLANATLPAKSITADISVVAVTF